VTNDTTLLKRAKAYDAAALTELYDCYAPKMYAYIYRRVSDAALAEDLTSEVFLRVLRAIRNGNGWRDSFVAWLYRIAHNLVVDHYRRRSPVPEISLDEDVVEQGSSPIASAEAAMDREYLWAAMSRLTSAQQEVLALRFGEGLTSREVAQVIQKTTGAVEALQHRALAALRRILPKEVYHDNITRRPGAPT
jgi:RNA polymerase sigma-70 factor (ECF subfamily)